MISTLLSKMTKYETRPYFYKKDTRSSTTSRPLTMQSTRSRVNNLQRLLFLTSSETIINSLFIILSALYLWSQNQKLPTTPGILWERHGNSFRKNIMTNGNSYAALQWLLFRTEKINIAQSINGRKTFFS